MEAAEQNKLIEQHPILADLKEAKEIVWINPDKVITAEGLILMMRKQDLRDLHHLSSGVSRRPGSATV